MASTYSPSLRLELIGPGEQAGVWNTTTNTNLGTLLETAIAGNVTVSVTSANQALTASNGVSDQSRQAILTLTTTTAAAFAIYAPPQTKQYIVYNTTAYAATIYNSTVLGNTTAAGLGVIVPAGRKLIVFSDTVNFRVLDASAGAITGILPVVNGGTGVAISTGTTAVVLSNSPTLVTPALGTPTALVGTNITGTASGLTAGNVTTNANLTGGVTSVGNAATVITNANLTGAVTSVGNATSLGSFTSAQLATALTNETGSGSAVFATSPTLITPALGTPSALVGTNITGTAAGLTAGNVTTNADLTGGVTSVGNAATVVTNANLTGAVTSVGNATLLGSFTSLQLLTALTNETGTGSAVFATSPTISSATLSSATLTAPILGTPTSGALDNCTSNTEAFGSSTTHLATTAFVQAALQALHPVGSVYTSTAATNPGTTFGFGTWAQFGAGRVLMGNGGSFGAGTTGGSNDAVVVSHTHTATVTDPAHAHTAPLFGEAGTAAVFADGGPAASGLNALTNTATTGISVTNAAAGVSGTNANLPPYVVVYIWNRTA